MMKLVYSVLQMQNISKRLRKKGKTIGFVATMGYLHEGHLSLARRSTRECDITVMSIYVNPRQFGRGEDFKRYPRDIKRDISLARKIGVDYLFIPKDKEIYPEPYLTSVEVSGINNILCGASRPGHFNGVTTIVAKLFNIVLPDIAYFGQKDAQQVVIIKKMVRDLNMPLKIRAIPIVREHDGLARSSRNVYLSGQERKDALALYQSLRRARDIIRSGERSCRWIIAQMKRLITGVKSVTIDYIAIVDADDLSEKKKIEGNLLIAGAVFIGKVRLIDNIVIRVR